MNKHNILITGGSGMVGKSLKDTIEKYPECKKYEWIFMSSKDCNLYNLNDTKNFFKKYNPKYVIHLDANVGGLYKNLREKVSMFRDNVRMNENVLQVCNELNVQRGIFILSSCIFPYNPSKYPMDESMIHESAPHPSNEGYGYSKRMMELQCRNYNEQYKRKYICLCPVNIYGPYDNFDLHNSHVIAGIIHRMHLAKEKNEKFIMFGTGEPLRQFLYAHDFAKMIVRTLFEYKDTKMIMCSNDEISIKDLTYTIADVMEYDKSLIENDTSKSDGCMRKTVSNEYFASLFNDFQYIKLKDGLSKTVKRFREEYDKP